jgi:hypothetical protein
MKKPVAELCVVVALCVVVVLLHSIDSKAVKYVGVGRTVVVRNRR